MKNIKRNEKGQSTVEFILTFAFGVSLILVIFSTSMNYATGYLVHYATFMASRVYLSSDNSLISPMASIGDAGQKAKDAFGVYNLSIFGVPNSNFDINPVEDGMSPSQYLTVGGRTTFELTIDVMGRITGGEKLEMVSESFLGKEPTRGECIKRTCYGITGSTECNQTNDVTLFDNGC